MKASDEQPKDFFIRTATGTEDFAGASFAAQIESMATRYGDVFTMDYGLPLPIGNPTHASGWLFTGQSYITGLVTEDGHMERP